MWIAKGVKGARRARKMSVQFDSTSGGGIIGSTPSEFGHLDVQVRGWQGTMANSTITLPGRLYERLARKSRRSERTPEEVVSDLVQRYLSEPDDRWQAEFRALLARVQARTAALSSEEIEADITLASAEAREQRCAARRTH